MAKEVSRIMAIGKGLLVFLILLLPFLSGFGQFAFNLNGRGFERYNGRITYLTFREDLPIGNSLEKLTATIVNGSFSFKGKMMNPGAYAFLDIDGERKNFGFVLDSGETNIQFNPSVFPKEIYPIQSETNKLYLEFTELNNSNISYEGLPVGNQTWRDFRLKQLELVKKNPANFYSAIRLADLSRRTSVTGSEIRAAWELMPDDIRSTETGKYIERKLLYSGGTAAGASLPPMEFVTQSGEVFTNSNLLQYPYLIVFSATWCKPCKELIPVIKSVQDKYKKYGLQVLYINMEDDTTKWNKMIRDYSLQQFTNVYDRVNFEESTMKFVFEVTAVPIVLVMDENRKIHYNSLKQEDYEIKSIELYLDRFLK